MLTRADLDAAVAQLMAAPYEPTQPMIMHPRDWVRTEAERRPGEQDAELIARLIREGK